MNQQGMLSLQLSAPAMVQSLATVKRALDEVAIGAVGGRKEKEALLRSDTYRTQIAYIRTGSFSKIRLAKLIGKADVSKASALAFLNSVKPAATADKMDYSAKFNDPALVLGEAMRRMKDAYGCYHPADESAKEFFEELNTIMLEAAAAGVAWATIGEKLWRHRL